MAEIDSPITSITGIGVRLGAVILAEIKNIHNFKTPGQLQTFAGLEPSIYQSGTMDITGHMVKRGRLIYATHLSKQLNYSLTIPPPFQSLLKTQNKPGKAL
ncbi:IS110 family transposase [Lactococcus lactis]|uniref:IS110 family transposase n=1 Tax=Lactococcus lactis TaxID=1358 RepID=UPI002890A58D|nr:IS110 family transposase [Lactococcus lactis]MDT2909240.1 IS110 family transposase [Lactococcus lactis]MDT2925230.1 IS110 family transposase [Lactococcus lactis]MDT2952089.1 IS110 family transposase [Lactococcus lactis]